MSRDIVESIFSMAPALRDGAAASSSYVMIRCPFHGGGSEKTPSCSVSRERPVFYCHGCHESGHISRLFRHLGTPRELIDTFLSEAGMTASTSAAKTSSKVGGKLITGVDPFRGQFVLDDDVLDAYRLAPYALLDAGFRMTTLRHFEVGYDGENFRITFPLRNLYGELVGISGRTLLENDDSVPRYKIYAKELISRKDIFVPPTYTMNAVKEAILWHAHIIRPVLQREGDTIIVTEGFRAAMWVWQAGHKNVVALVGSSLGEYHAEILATYAKNVILFLDNNEAGRRGTYYAAARVEKKGLIPTVAKYPDDRQQPDHLDPDEVTEALSGATTFREWRRENQDVQYEASQRRFYRSRGRSPS
jgi:DNA primase